MSDTSIQNDGTKKALVISISDYEKLPSLPFCKNDGLEISKLLKSLGYEIKNEHNLVGMVTKDQIEDAIDSFFTDDHIKRKDLLFFYYSGHGVPEDSGDHYVASTEIDPYHPWRSGYSFDDLSDMIDRCNSERKVIVLDCCYSGSADLGKGTEDASISAGMEATNTKIKSGYGKCILAACRGTQESFARKEGDNSQFTYYLLDGLRGGNGEAVDEHGSVTPEKLSNYVIDKLDSLPLDKKPLQRPMIKIEASGDIVLANYPNLALIKKESVASVTEKESFSDSTENIQENIVGMLEYVYAEEHHSDGIGPHHNSHTTIIPYAIFFTSSRLIVGFTGGPDSASDPTKWNVKLGIYIPHPHERAIQLRVMPPDEIVQLDSKNISVPYNQITSIVLKKGNFLSTPSIEIHTVNHSNYLKFEKKEFDEYAKVVKNAFPDRLKIN